jgi:2-polyprenyl-3-methyl-5-hydroxy-6-metoxy-1,4-benzoquinol methylase
MNEETCPVCEAVLSKGIKSWHLFCLGCHYESSRLNPNLLDSSIHESIDVEKWEDGLKSTRVENYKTILASIKKYKPNGSLLDVGCANGCFLDLAKNDFQVAGIEPQKKFYEMCTSKGLNVFNGIFPDSLDASQAYDIITFNDVLEHIPNAAGIIRACAKHLKDDGIVVINIPSSNGVIYKASKVLSFFGINQYFNRMWQKETYTPHIHYFNKKNLVRILENEKFSTIEVGNLNTLAVRNIKELYNRVVNVQKENKILQLLAFFVILVLYPVLKLLPRDIMCVIAEKKTY